LQEQGLIARALRVARDARFFAADQDIRHQTASIFSSLFGAQEAVIVADGNTYEAAGRDVEASFFRENQAQYQPFIFGPHVYADDKCVQELEQALRPHPGVPVAVGSGTINDLTKLVSHRLKRPYMVVGTAASMDGYAAFGASILKDGSKETIDCPGPRAVLADLDVIGRAPVRMNASGYADLLASISTGGLACAMAQDGTPTLSQSRVPHDL
jgi:glycerol-1-phosphate dehydrogenase [NAD(P)+]